MAEAEATPRKGLIVKLYLPRSEKRGPPSEASDSRGQKRMKHHCNTEYSEDGKSEAKGSETVSSEECKLKDDADSHIERRNVATTAEVSAMATKGKSKTTEYPTRCFVQEDKRADSRISRTGLEECKLKKGVEFKKEEIPKVQRMDRSKKMQCWVILKRLMIGRDGWAFKQPLDLKDFGILDNSESTPKPMDLKNVNSKLKNSETVLKPIRLEDIESKLNKSVYSGPDEFADDMRLVFSYALMYPPRNEIHRIARRLSESFELSWKSLKDKWSSEERKRTKILKREVFYEKKTQKENKGSSGDFEDSQLCVDKSLRRQKSGRTDTDSCSNFQTRSRYCT